MKYFIIKWVAFFSIIFSVTLCYVGFVNGNVSGDLGVLGRIPFSNEYDVRIRTLDYTHNIQSELVDIDSAGCYPLLMIGDSFTEPENALGHTISKTVGDTIRVICDVTFTNNYQPTQTLLYGLRHNCFRPGQTVILESIGRSLLDRFGRLDFENDSKPDRLRPIENWREQQQNTLKSIAERRENGAHAEFALNDMLTWIRTRLGYKAVVKHCKLTHKMFDHNRYGSELYYFKDDHVVCNMPQEQLDMIAVGVNKFFAIAEQQGIKLYLFITPDKFDLYYPYLIDPPLPRPNVLRFIDGIDARYADRIFCTRDSLAPYLERGVLDVYRLNDSHWSVFAAEEMGRAIGRKILRDQQIGQTINIPSMN